MILRAELVVVVVVVVTLAWRTVSVRIPVTEASPFCRKQPHGFICNFFNTTQDVMIGSGPLAPGVASQHPAISCPCCPATLDVSNNSSVNPTVGKAVTSDQLHATQPSPNRTVANVTTAHTSFGRRVSVEPRNASKTLHQPQRDCAVNVSVEDSTVHRVRGHFVVAQFHDSKVEDLDGVYMLLDVKSTLVFNMSLSGEIIEVEDTKIKLVTQLKAGRHLQLRRSELGTVAPHGLQFLSPGPEEPQRPHMLSDMTIQKLEAGSLVVAGARVNVTNVTVGWLARDAVTVRTKGVLTMTDVIFHCNELYDCLNLERGARLILRNMTVRNRTITKMDLEATSIANTYPLFALVSKDDRRPLVMTFPWYWMVIMSACGIVAGLVIGSALMWKRPSLPGGLTSTLTLSDLLSHDRLQENNGETGRDHTIGHLMLPTLTRQDSGLTSSSFASYKPFQTPNIEPGVSSSCNNTVCDDM